MEEKPRVLIVSSVVPSLSRGGGCLALHRHFCARNDFAVAVTSYDAARCSCLEILRIPRTEWWRRAKRTRLARILENVDYLIAGWRLPRSLARFACDWQPDLIFSVADDVHAPIGFRLARRLGIPFAIDFQDLFVYSSFLSPTQRPFHFLRPVLLARSARLQANADAVFHTCPGMRQWFRKSGRGDILYPLAAERQNNAENSTKLPSANIKLVYAGNCYGSYGRMMLRLARLVKGHSMISLKIFTMGNDWAAHDVEQLSEAGIYRGFLPFNELNTFLKRADAFLIAMSFDERDRTFMETSFPTKWGDYTSHGKPIFVWAPEYSSSVAFARASGAGVTVEDPDPAAVVVAIERLAAHPNHWTSVGHAAARAAKTELNAERLHSLLRQRLLDLIGANRARRGSASAK